MFNGFDWFGNVLEVREVGFFIAFIQRVLMIRTDLPILVLVVVAVSEVASGAGSVVRAFEVALVEDLVVVSAAALAAAASVVEEDLVVDTADEAATGTAALAAMPAVKTVAGLSATIFMPITTGQTVLQTAECR